MVMQNKKQYSLVRWTCLWFIKHPNLLEFIRGAYFVLISSSILNFAFRFAGLSNFSLILYGFGILFFCIGGGCAYSMVTRLRKHEEKYRKQNEQQKQQENSLNFYCNLEKRKAFQYCAFYFSWLVALFFIGWSGKWL